MLTKINQNPPEQESTDIQNQAHEQVSHVSLCFTDNKWQALVSDPSSLQPLSDSTMVTGLRTGNAQPWTGCLPTKNPCWLLLLAFIRLLKHFPLTAYSILIIRHPGTVWRSSLHPAVPTSCILSALCTNSNTPLSYLAEVDKISQQSFSWKSQAHTEFCYTGRDRFT